jgi:hypothetical protein
VIAVIGSSPAQQAKYGFRGPESSGDRKNHG